MTKLMFDLVLAVLPRFLLRKYLCVLVKTKLVLHHIFKLTFKNWTCTQDQKHIPKIISILYEDQPVLMKTWIFYTDSFTRGVYFPPVGEVIINMGNNIDLCVILDEIIMMIISPSGWYYRPLDDIINVCVKLKNTSISPG